MKQIIELLKSHKIVVTKQRIELLDLLTKEQYPLSLSQMYAIIKQINFSSIFRIIKLFEKKGIICETSFSDGVPRYYFNNKAYHQHFIKCERCGKMEIIDFCNINEIQGITNFKVLNHSLNLSGICPSCI